MKWLSSTRYWLKHLHNQKFLFFLITLRVTSRDTIDLSALLCGSTAVVHTGKSVVSSTATQLRAAIPKDNLSRLIENNYSDFIGFIFFQWYQIQRQLKDQKSRLFFVLVIPHNSCCCHPDSHTCQQEHTGSLTAQNLVYRNSRWHRAQCS